MASKNLHRVAPIHPFFLVVFSLLSFSMACSLAGGGTGATPAGSAGAAASVEIPSDRGPAPTPVLTGPVDIGQPFLICKTAVTVVGWDNVAPGEYFKPEAGNRFVAADIILVNLGPDTIETSWYTFGLRDAFDKSLPEGEFPVTLARGTILSGGLAVGERTRGMVGYEVPEAEQELSLKAGCVNYDDGSQEEMVVRLGSKPIAVEVPGMFAGEVVEDPLAVGKSARVNAVEISVREIIPFQEKYLDPDSHPRVSPPMSWMKYIIVDLALENVGGEKVELTRFSDFYARDPEGWRYAAISWADQVLADPIREFITMGPGDKLSGQVVLMIPKDPGHLFFVFEYGYGRAGRHAFFRMM